MFLVARRLLGDEIAAVTAWIGVTRPVGLIAAVLVTLVVGPPRCGCTQRIAATQCMWRRGSASRWAIFIIAGLNLAVRLFVQR